MEEFKELIDIMKMLRSENGCNWDREQSYNSLRPFLLEEAHEVIEAILSDDMDALKEELGDLLLQVIFLSQIATEDGVFTIKDVTRGINEKLIRRHPHVFGGEKNQVASEHILKRWEEIKAQEKKEKKQERASMLDGVPITLPALTEAYKIQGKVKRVGFDFPTFNEAWEKVREEFEELTHMIEEGDERRVEEELGDMFFALVNMARFRKIDSEGALKRTNKKFRTRFAYIERTLKGKGKRIEDATLAEMDALWNESKQYETHDETGDPVLSVYETGKGDDVAS